MPKATYSIVTKLMFAALGELPCQRHPDTDFILQNEATVLRNRQEFQRSQLTELASIDFVSWGKESYGLRRRLLIKTVDGSGFREVGIGTAR